MANRHTEHVHDAACNQKMHCYCAGQQPTRRSARVGQRRSAPQRWTYDAGSSDCELSSDEDNEHAPRGRHAHVPHIHGRAPPQHSSEQSEADPESWHGTGSSSRAPWQRSVGCVDLKSFRRQPACEDLGQQSEVAWSIIQRMQAHGTLQDDDQSQAQHHSPERLARLEHARPDSPSSPEEWFDVRESASSPSSPEGRLSEEGRPVSGPGGAPLPVAAPSLTYVQHHPCLGCPYQQTLAENTVKGCM